ncbi:MAG: hypothetical protein R3326_03175 [Gemmatimonadota bacterium]|nr:hypothetical protein [Gemmatimonadota bacterium]
MSPAEWVDLVSGTEDQREAMARILVEAFAELAPDAWSTIDAEVGSGAENRRAEEGSGG